MAHRIKSNIFLLRIFLPFCYVGFFIVQCFFNFEPVVIAKSNTVQASSVFAHESILQKATNHQSQKEKIRLNKRFQPSTTPTVSYKVDEPIIRYISVATPGFSDQFIPNALRIASLLRGPPIVA